MNKIEVPILQQEFAEHLAKYRVKGEMVNTIAENIAEVGGATIFEDPELLNQKLASWSQYIAASLRKQILDHWFAKKGIPVDEETAQKFALTMTETRKAAKKAERKKKATEGEVWVVKVDDKSMPRIMMAGENEQGVTLEEAKRAIREIRKEYGAEESLVIYDERLGRHTPNFKSDFVRQNPMVGWAAAKQMDKAIAEGAELDPIDTFVELMARAEQLREAVGGKKDAEPKGTIGEIIQGVKDLQSMTKGGEGDGLRIELAELRKSLDDMREQRHREQVEAQQRQIAVLADKMGELTDLVIDLKRPVTGRTEMDILHEVATESFSLAKTELTGLRRDIKEAVMGGALPAPKTPQEREDRTAKLRQGIKRDREIEEIGRRLYFGEGREPEKPEPPPPELSPELPQPPEPKAPTAFE